MHYDTCDVLVVGAGPAGLAAAITLARHGIDVLVAERHAGTSPFPKATGVSTRTMELLRCWGLEQQVRAGAMQVHPALSISETLASAQRIETLIGYPSDEQALAVSPTRPCFCPQDHLEPVLAEHLIARGGRVRFSTEVTQLAAGAAGVDAELRDRRHGRVERVRARYVIGADGPRSGVRSGLGIEVDELGTLGEVLAVTFRADLSRRLPQPVYGLNAVEVPEAAGLFVPTSADDRWIYARECLPGRGDRLGDWTPQRCTELIRAGTGLPDLCPEILSVMQFEMGGHVATALRAGRVFLVGDAAHRMTPMGGIGMNTAIHAAHNLGWKLAWVLRGWAGEALLDSYETERRPVGTANVLHSLCREHETEQECLARDIGVQYSSAVVAAGTGDRAPHAWVRRGGSRVSTLDLFEGRLTVLTGSRGEPWRRAVAELAAGGLPITALSLGCDLCDDLYDEDGACARQLKLGERDAVLVRPDGYLAWRSRGPLTDARPALRSALTRTLAWPAQAQAA